MYYDLLLNIEVLFDRLIFFNLEYPMKTAQYGTWESPISPQMIAEGGTTILNMLIDEDSTYWCETRPTNKGRYTIVCRNTDGTIRDVTPPDFNVRTFVHEYGGGAFTVSQGVVYASNALDHAIYIIHPNQKPVKLTDGTTRFADMRVSPYGLLAVGEQHIDQQPVRNFLALINISTGIHQELTNGYDFYAAPAVSQDGKQLAWICWNHPEMPWTKSELWIADFQTSGQLVNARQIGMDTSETILQPQWSENGILYFITDRDNGWWNLHRYLNHKVENICPLKAEAGEPLWIFDKSTYAILNNQIYFTYNANGIWHLGVLDTHTNTWKQIPRKGIVISHLRASKNCIRFLEHYTTQGKALIQVDNLPGYPDHILIQDTQPIAKEDISIGQHISFPSGSRMAHGWFYPPKNQNFKGPAGDKPPLIVMIHGGPTAQANAGFQLKQQFWTTRGFAVLDVNYGGSTGYGKAYRDLLNGTWGIVDVEDCENGALFLVHQGLVDPTKLVIRGGSAGGYTTLAALAFRNTFKAGASYFGVADITALAQDTHKFEAKYIDQLIGKYPEQKAIWEARSPINSVDNINVPLIIFQGEDDTVVPVNQSTMIYEALKRRNISTELYIYPGEGHGFKQASTIIDTLEKELAFYLNVFNKPLA